MNFTSKLRHYINLKLLTQLYYSLIYPYLTYAILVWGNAYQTTTRPLYILQKKVLRIITFSPFDAHSSPIFKQLQIIKLPDLVHLHTSNFMYDFHSNNLPLIFSDFFKPVSSIHSYNTRLASKSSLYLPHARTNYGIFNIRYNGAKIWNTIDIEVRNLPKKHFIKKLKNNYLNTYIP